MVPAGVAILDQTAAAHAQCSGTGRLMTLISSITVLFSFRHSRWFIPAEALAVIGRHAND
eukprot:12774663-Alexandrium_andersonii.AAC.1